jgi:hypothetical protein
MAPAHGRGCRPSRDHCERPVLHGTQIARYARLGSLLNVRNSRTSTDVGWAAANAAATKPTILVTRPAASKTVDEAVHTRPPALARPVA